MRSDYMEWVKIQTAGVKFNLANSGLMSYPLKELGVDFGGFDLSGPGAYGYPPLKAAIAAKEGVSEDCVTTALGTSGANWLAMAALLEPGDEVIMEHPGYPLMWETAKFMGAEVKFVKRPLDLDEVKRTVTAKTRLIMVTNLHNPTCAFMGETELLALGSIADTVGARVLVDEVYLDLLGNTTPKSAFHLGGPFLTTNSLTKVYGLSGLRCGWVLADAELTHKMLRLNDLFGVNNPYITDQISCIALAKLGQIAAWSQGILKTNIALANEFLAATPDLINEPLRVGTVLFPRVEFNVEQLCGFLREKFETVVTPGKFFGTPDYIRIGVGSDPKYFSDAIHQLQAGIAAFLRG